MRAQRSRQRRLPERRTGVVANRHSRAVRDRTLVGEQKQSAGGEQYFALLRNATKLPPAMRYGDKSS